MKLIVRNNKILGAVGDTYNGPEKTIEAPEGFEAFHPSDFRIVEGKAVLDLYTVAVRLTQENLDAFARTRGYDGILSACTYATSTLSRFKVEGQFCVELRDKTWAALYEILDAVNAGEREVPTAYSQIEGELPKLEWPQAKPTSAETSSEPATDPTA